MIKKKKILVVINRGPVELDWLMPIIFVLKKNFDIYFIFNSKKSFFKLKENKSLYLIFKSMCSEYYIISKYKNLMHKMIRLILSKFVKYQFIRRLIYNLNNKINNIFQFKDTKINFDISFFEYASNSGIPIFLKDNTDTKIVYYPGTVLPLATDKKNLFLKKMKIVGSYIIVNSLNKKFKKIFKNKKIIYMGNPKYADWWLKKFEKKKINKKKVALFVSNAHLKISKKDLIKLKNNFFSIIKTILSFNNLTLLLKIHPVKDNPYYLEVINKFPSNRIKISTDSIYTLSHNSNVVIASSSSAGVLDGIANKKPTIGIWNNDINVMIGHSRYPKKEEKIMDFVRADNNNVLKNFLSSAINNPNDFIWKKQYKNFVNYFQSRNISQKKIELTFKKLIN